MGKIFRWERSWITGNIPDQSNVGSRCFWKIKGKWKGQIRGKVLNCKASVQIDSLGLA